MKTKNNYINNFKEIYYIPISQQSPQLLHTLDTWTKWLRLWSILSL